jgi:hypothetical protein
MSTAPTEPTPPGSGSHTGLSREAVSGAILPFPGNAEFAVYVIATIFLIIVWAASDGLDAGGFAQWFTWLTVGYVLSRGIAKASRVLEH